MSQYSPVLRPIFRSEANHGGVMVALRLPVAAAQALAVPGGESAEDLHLTLAYLGDAEDLDPRRLDDLLARLEALGATTAPFPGRITGYGHFLNDGTDVLWSHVDAPDLPAFRHKVAQACVDAGLDPDREHGFTPHVTLGYYEDDPAPARPLFLGPIDLDFRAFHLVVAGEDDQTVAMGGTADGPGDPQSVMEPETLSALQSGDEVGSGADLASAVASWGAALVRPLVDGRACVVVKKGADVRVAVAGMDDGAYLADFAAGFRRINHDFIVEGVLLAKDLRGRWVDPAPALALSEVAVPTLFASDVLAMDGDLTEKPAWERHQFLRVLLAPVGRYAVVPPAVECAATLVEAAADEAMAWEPSEGEGFPNVGAVAVRVDSKYTHGESEDEVTWLAVGEQTRKDIFTSVGEVGMLAPQQGMFRRRRRSRFMNTVGNVSKKLSAADAAAVKTESATIARNAKIWENKSHAFRAAKWTHPNGHPRCSRCGAEEPVGGMCGMPAAWYARREVAPADQALAKDWGGRVEASPPGSVASGEKPRPNWPTIPLVTLSKEGVTKEDGDRLPLHQRSHAFVVGRLIDGEIKPDPKVPRVNPYESIFQRAGISLAPVNPYVVKWDESMVTRDPGGDGGGQFVSGGGSGVDEGGPGGPDSSDDVQPTSGPPSREPSEEDRVPSEATMRWLDDVEEHPEFVKARAANQGPTTMEEHSKDGEYTAERQSVHRDFVGRMLKETSRVPEGETPRIVLVMGTPGAGKTSTLQVEGLAADNPKFSTISADDVRSMIPGYSGYNSELVHDEASHVANRLALSLAGKARMNIVFDGTGKTYDTYVEYARSFKELGYDVELLYVSVPTEVSARRAVDRFLNDPRAGHRYVNPRRVLVDVDAKPTDTYNRLKASGFISRATEYDNNVPHGHPPRRVEDTRYPGTARSAAVRSDAPGRVRGVGRPLGARRNSRPSEAVARRAGSVHRVAEVDGIFWGTDGHPREVQPAAHEAEGSHPDRIALGKCYDEAGRYIALTAPHGSRSVAKLVHGTVVIGGAWEGGVRKSQTGVSIGHAWVEFSDKVYDGVMGRFYEKADYYKKLSAVREHEYTEDQARAMMVKTRMFGPWAGSAGMLGGPGGPGRRRR